MKIRKKTTATILIALFMISTLGMALPAYAEEVNLVVPITPVPTEDVIVIDLPSGFTLGDLKTISWMVKMVKGYPLHVDIILVDDIDEVENIDSLTAEIGENDNPSNLEWQIGSPNLKESYVYDVYHKTFEYADGVGDSVVDDETVLWVTRWGAGCDDAPYGTLEELKAGTVTNLYGDPTITIDEFTEIDRLEFEIDNWLGEAEAYILDIKINSQPAVSLSGDARPPLTSISVDPTELNFGELVLGEFYEFSDPDIIVYNTGETDVSLTVELIDDDGFFHGCLLLDDATYSAYGEVVLEGASAEVDVDLDISRTAEPGTHTAVLVFWAEEYIT